ncbi:hydrogenase formation protein HypD [Carboxydothermus pertinax]|uniref:Hydrogenase formation protein HypD n=1 Tax=Carboxydothermus pertinax TaxID=870242 RepID=A0A1L8CXZ4_9THEO|nr:hydrogenase formation protein HypD [Carboxydothermus pertinax]GAV23780.1 hydrogenase formation protein HypD [Carboxydothermus pertinax]
MGMINANLLKMFNNLMNLAKEKGQTINLMEVCGTHTMALFEHGIRSLLPENINLVSGPGCPVCVTGEEVIVEAMDLIENNTVTMFTFGDMMKVPGEGRTLNELKAQGFPIKVAYSPRVALEFAEKNPKIEVVFFGAGFETTAPALGAVILEAFNKKLNNFSVILSVKTVPPAIHFLFSQEIRINGFILPGHVSAVIGAKSFRFITEKYQVPAVVTGFTAEELLLGISLVVNSILKREPGYYNAYPTVVREHGNIVAQKIISEVFEIGDAYWRGIGNIPSSGLFLKEKFAKFDAKKKFGLKDRQPIIPRGCKCGEIMLGKVLPPACPLFGKACTPEKPVGACMVSSEGSCAAYFKYGRR